MKFKILSELSYEVLSPVTFLFNIQPCRSANQAVIEESLCITPSLRFEEFLLDNSDTRYLKVHARHGESFTIKYEALVDVRYSIIEEPEHLPSAPMMQLDKEVWPYLFPSRHCQSDKFRKFASKQFGHLHNEYRKVLAINDWIFNNNDYIPGTTDSGTSAYDTLIRREGVCKDFAHLGIALCRAADIPARYFTGYAHNLKPPDFHACFEAYIGGRWIFFDPTKLVPVNGLVKIASSKDAADAAVANFFGNTNCTYINVQCTPADASFFPMDPRAGCLQALSYQ